MRLGGRQLLAGLDLRVERSEVVAIVGPSGSGKTTLLNVIAGVRTPDEGEVRITARSFTGLDDDARAAHRLRHIGMVFQFGELLPELTVLENVALPARLAGTGRLEAEGTAASWLDRLGVGSLAAARPVTLSGGEVQRVAIARALATGPEVVLADEPTGSLDEVTGQIVVETLVGAVRSSGCALVLVTHDPEVARHADRTCALESGALVERPRRSPDG